MSNIQTLVESRVKVMDQRLVISMTLLEFMAERGITFAALGKRIDMTGRQVRKAMDPARDVYFGELFKVAYGLGFKLEVKIHGLDD